MKRLVNDMDGIFFKVSLVGVVISAIVVAVFYFFPLHSSTDLVEAESVVDESISDLPDYDPISFSVFDGEFSRIYIWTDEETGVQYIIYREKSGYAGFGGITPRLNTDGSLYVLDEKEVTPSAVATE
ncbi:MAG: hypothetical protein [Inoviridae sp.]|nr:MAG: hypothetical protein [Inoviridae sp.]